MSLVAVGQKMLFDHEKSMRPAGLGQQLPVAPVSIFPWQSSSSLPGMTRGIATGYHRWLPGCRLPGAWAAARGKLDPGTGLVGGGRVNGQPVSCQAMCEKKPAGQESLSQIPWQELGMRSLSPLHHLLRLSPAVAAGQGG